MVMESITGHFVSECLVFYCVEIRQDTCTSYTSDIIMKCMVRKLLLYMLETYFLNNMKVN
jgi:hypothetical protein